MAFGKEREIIHAHFGHFKNFKYVPSLAKRIGKASANGYVINVPFERDGYKANAILKSSMTNYSDNLLYEYTVGLWLNTLGANVPCLLETYGLFMYRSAKKWEHMSVQKEYKNLDKYVVELNDTFENMIEKSCKTPTHVCVLVQHLNDVKSINDVIIDTSTKANHVFPEYEMLTSLFQIYFFLSLYRESFTHYDLHADNVLLYTPKKGKYIEYVYYLSETENISFYSTVIPKIIDYGRCHISGSGMFLNHLCNQSACNPQCGTDVGYQWFDNSPPETAPYHISLEYPNVSHDLRLYNIVKHFYNSPLFVSMKPCLYQGEYGTPPVREFNSDPNLIKNVSDCFIHLLDVIRSYPAPSVPPKKDIIATMHVYGDKPMNVIYY